MDVIRCDNDGENKVLLQKCNEEKLKIKFEFTSPRTPQQNGLVEREFETFWSRLRAMLIHAKLDTTQKKRIWAEGGNCQLQLKKLRLQKVKRIHRSQNSMEERLHTQDI